MPFSINRSATSAGAPSLASVVLAAVATLFVAASAALAQVPIFGDGFEIGTPGRWTETAPPSLMACNCYFSGDCLGGFCDYGILSEEDNCSYAQPKPQSVPGAGCDIDWPGPFQLGICDGRCVASAAGSSLGSFDPAILAEGVTLWSEAVLRPAEGGGGPVEPALAAAAMALAIGEVEASILGRQVVSLISETSGTSFYDYFCHFEAGHPPVQRYPNLAGNTCRIMAGRIAAAALVSELLDWPGGASGVSEISRYCAANERAFGATCPGGPGAIACLQTRVEDLARFLTTPRQESLFPTPADRRLRLAPR